MSETGNRKMNAIELIRKKTIDDMKKKLRVFSKCMVVRCTGFGKTVMLAELTTEYKNVLFLYPADIVMETAGMVIKNLTGTYNSGQENTNVGNVTFMSYMKLVRLSDSEVSWLGKRYDLIVMDECHRCGAERTGAAVHKLMDACKGHIVGATATVDRSDAVDVTEEFFGGICVEEYTIHDAFCDGMIKRPVYAFMSYDIETDLKEEALTAGEDFDDLRVTDVYKQEFFNIKQIFNVPQMLKNITEKYMPAAEYMKYIVFFPDFEQLHKKEKEVEGWFAEAFPEYTFSSLIITSETKEYAENIKKLSELENRDKHIDLILVVDMLNLGYHVNDLTGIAMYRCTTSSIIFSQQLGRALSSGSDRQCLVFDIVDNLHRKSAFTLAKKGNRKKRRDSAINIIRSVDIEKIDDDERLKLMKKVAASGSVHRDAAKAIVHVLEHPFNEKEKEEGMELMKEFIDAVHYSDTHAYWWAKASDIREDDVVMAQVEGDSYEATYRELIAKVIATSYMIRAKRAREAHEARWRKINTEPYPQTQAAMRKNVDTVPPLLPYARWQNVTIWQILETQFPDVS